MNFRRIQYQSGSMLFVFFDSVRIKYLARNLFNKSICSLLLIDILVFMIHIINQMTAAVRLRNSKKPIVAVALAITIVTLTVR